MNDMLVRYFMAEKNEALLFILIGIVAVAVSLYLIKTGNSYITISYPLVLIALIQIAVGSTVFFRTDRQVSKLRVQMTANMQQFKSDERARMEKVLSGFKLYKTIEIILLAFGIILTFIARGSAFWYPVGIGLILQSSLMLVLDLFAEKRALDYMQFLQ